MARGKSFTWLCFVATWCAEAIKVLGDDGKGHSWQLLAAFDWLLENAEQSWDTQ